MEELKKELEAKDFNILMIGIDIYRINYSINELKKILEKYKEDRGLLKYM